MIKRPMSRAFRITRIMLIVEIMKDNIENKR